MIDEEDYTRRGMRKRGIRRAHQVITVTRFYGSKVKDYGVQPYKKPGVMKPQIMVEYEPDVKRTRSKKISEKDLEDASGIITINETLLYFNKLREKYKNSYDYYRRYNRYDEAVNYIELD